MLKKSLLALALLSFSIIATAQNQSPTGYWIAYHTDFNEPVGIVKITEYKGHLLGQVVRVTPINKSLLKVCPQCKEFILKRPLTGPVMMCDYKRSGKRSWKRGYILDSKTSKVYKSTMQLSNDGKTLYIRALVGFLFRTTKWKRISKEKINEFLLGQIKAL